MSSFVYRGQSIFYYAACSLSLGSVCVGGVVSLTVGMAVRPNDGKLRVFEEN